MSHIRVVELQHDANGSLGLSIAGGVGSNLGDTPIMVANLTPGGPADRCRKLKVKTVSEYFKVILSFVFRLSFDIAFIICWSYCLVLKLKD